MDSVKAFIELLQSDPLLMEKASSIAPSDIQSVLNLAREQGFSFTADEYKSYLNSSTPNSSELSDDDLSLLSGGVGVQNLAGLFASAVVASGSNLGSSVASTSSGSGW